MKIIYNNVIPFKGYRAINLFGVLFVRKDIEAPIDKVVINHESIHSQQMKEMLWIPFYIWYVIEWLIKVCIYFDTHMAYRRISFEREAYNNEKNLEYLKERKHYCWLKLLKG